MKKNTMMRLASALLVLVLLTTCAISGTFAKYVTANDAEDGARVAKWGVNFSLTKTDDKDLFTAEYAENNDPQSSGVSVKAYNGDKLVAPGTSGNLITFAVTEEADAPEVSYEVTFAITDTADTVWLKQGSETYEPIVWTVKLGENAETTYTLAEMVAAIEGYKFYYNVDDGKYYEWSNGAWETTGSDTAPSVTVNWAWDFDDSGAGTNDVYDTLLGDYAAGIDLPTGVTANLTISIELTATATQLD